MVREKSNKINLYKVTPEHEFGDFEFDGVDGFIKEFEDETRKLFIQRHKPGTPHWVKYLKPLIVSDPDKIVNYSSSFILIVKHNENLYALSGGSGFAKLEKYVEGDFGVRLALRMITEKGILALNQRSLKGSTRQIFRAVLGYDPIFDKENFTRVLNSIAGTGEFDGKSFRIDGKAALALRTIKGIAHLTEVLEEVERVAAQQERIHFPKSFVVEKKTELINALDKEMLRLVKAFWGGSEGRERLYLEFKDVFTQFRCSTFKGKHGRINIEFEDFDLDVMKNLFHQNGLTEIQSMEDLDKIIFQGVNEDGFEEFKESFRDLLVCEVSLEGQSFIKIGNHWLRILEEIQKFIDNELKTMEVLKGFLPDWDKNQHKEELDYNNFVASQRNWRCLDQDCIQIQGASKIEVCDIFDKTNKRFFHIKQTWGSKSSYLFNQGITAAEFFYNSSDFRQKCVDKWPDQFRGDYLNYGVVFGIAADKAMENEFPANMTFFAKFNLYNAIAVLKQMDYKAYLAPIKIVF